MGCPFCMTAKYGFYGDLTAGDIVNQVIGIPFADKITHVVFMGMGEPLHNLDNVVAALQILYATEGFAFGQRKITLSTSGLVPEMLELGRHLGLKTIIGITSHPDSQLRELSDIILDMGVIEEPCPPA